MATSSSASISSRAAVRSVVGPINQGQAMDQHTSTTDMYNYQQEIRYQQYRQQNYPGYNPLMQQYRQQNYPGYNPLMQQYCQQNYPGYNPLMQQYQDHGYQTQPQLQGSSQNAAQSSVQSGAYVLPQLRQPSQRQVPHVEQQPQCPARAVARHPSYQRSQPGLRTLGSHQQVIGSQDRASARLSESQVAMQGQHSTMPPEGTQPTREQKQRHVSHLPSESLQQSITHAPVLHGQKECKPSDATNDLGKQGTLQKVSQQDMKAPGPSNMGHHQQQRLSESHVTMQGQHPMPPKGTQPTREQNQPHVSHLPSESLQPNRGTLQKVSQQDTGAPGPSNMGQHQQQQEQTGNNSTQVAQTTLPTNDSSLHVAELTQKQLSTNIIENVFPAEDWQMRRDKAYAIHHGQQYNRPGDPRNYEAPGVLQPWEENGWEEKSLRVNTLCSRRKEYYLDLDCSYLGAVFRNSEVEAVNRHDNGKVARMKFPSRAHATAVFEKFDGKILPGHPDRILRLAWFISPPPPAKTKSAVEGNPLKRVAESCSTRCSKRVKIDILDIFQPFEDFIALGDRKVVEPSEFRAAYVVGSVKPLDPRSSKVSATALGSDIIDGLVAYVKRNHRMKKTWGGKFTRRDLLVSESGCCISVVPDAHFCSVNVKLDDKRLFELTFPFYEIDGNLPAYFSDLLEVIRNAPNDMETNDAALDEYINRMLNSPALPKAHHRLHLLADFYITIMGLPPMDRDKVVRMVGSMVGEANASLEDWRAVTNKDRLLQTMFTDNWRLDKFDEEQEFPRFGNLLIHQAIGLRHLIVHTLQYSLLHGRQIFEDLRELDLFIFHYYPTFYPSFVAALLKLRINYPVMHTALRNYTQR